MDRDEHDPARDEVGHADRRDDLREPDDDEQVEPGTEPWVEDDDAEP
jgi:hypothetical protein